MKTIKNNIIERIYNSGLVKKIIVQSFGNVLSVSNRDDFEQFIMLTLLEMSESKLKELDENNAFGPYIYYIIRANLFNNRSKWNKLYGDNNLNIEHNYDVSEEFIENTAFRSDTELSNNYEDINI